eukprot:COSAG05_NODE_1735_length_4177_cov_1.826876_2_plen_90_part_00
MVVYLIVYFLVRRFRNQMEDDMHTLKLEHETMLETLYRNRDRVQLDSEQQSEMLRRTISVDMESRHERVRALDANQQRVQNRMVSIYLQ